MSKVLILLSVTLLFSFTAQGATIKYYELYEGENDELLDEDDSSVDEKLSDSLNSDNPGVVNIGDMILTRRQYRFLYKNDTSRRHGLSDAVQLWPKGVVPVVIDEDAQFDPNFEAELKKAMAYISEVSCIKFDLNPTEPENYLVIARGQACASEVGRQTEARAQFMKVGEQCSVGNLVHEFLHVLGFLHMHTATQRDDFVKINWKNIKPEAEKNFEKITANVSMFDTQYDYRSIMHYSPKAFAKNNQIKTIIPIEPVSTMGQRKGMTEGDITRLNRMYKCPEWLEQERYNVNIEESFEGQEDPSKAMGQIIDEKRGGGKVQQIIVTNNNESHTQAVFLRSAMEILDSILSPLTLLKEKLTSFLNEVENRSVTQELVN